MSSISQDTSKFQGWVAYDKHAADGHMKWGSFAPKPFENSDVDIEITHCGVCSTDIHTLRSDWGPANYPLVVGHEIVGNVIRVGKNVVDIKVGDRVGVGAQCDACLCRKPPETKHDFSGCQECKEGKENWCPLASTTYNSFFHSVGSGNAKTMGGYARFHRCPSHFVFKIPPALKSEEAAPLLCAGATVYSALLGGSSPGFENLHRHLRGRRVGVVGIGGLGHLAIRFAREMGADYILGISRRHGKRSDALALGADDYVATEDESDWMTTHGSTLDLIISTVGNNISITNHLQLLKRGGRYVYVGMPGDGGALEVNWTLLVLKQIEITGSLISSPVEMREMLQFAAEKGIVPWTEVVDMRHANRAMLRAETGKAKYRIVLQNHRPSSLRARL